VPVRLRMLSEPRKRVDRVIGSCLLASGLQSQAEAAFEITEDEHTSHIPIQQLHQPTQPVLQV
jgi:hypothetical protein